LLDTGLQNHFAVAVLLAVIVLFLIVIGSDLRGRILTPRNQTTPFAQAKWRNPNTIARPSWRPHGLSCPWR
jgi:hypothetical protein